MKDYIKGNKEAWEEAFAVSETGFGEKDAEVLKKEEFPFLYEDFVKELKKFDLQGKRVLQLCCNNGRELMSIVKSMKASSGVGIDIAENIVAQANENAEKSGIPCQFLCGNVLDVRKELEGQFDAVVLLIGAISWFEDLNEFFQVVSGYLKKGGILLVQEIHPCTNMLAVNGEEIYDAKNPLKISWSYFKDEPFVDDFGMGYITGKSYKSKVFTSFTYKMSDVINGICQNGMQILNLKEMDYDIGGEFPILNGKGFPLSFLLSARK